MNGVQIIALYAARRWTEDSDIELFQSEWNKIREKINAIPTADVISVVRYKDCKYALINPSGAILCSVSMQMKKQGGFCDAGDKSEEIYNG